MGRRGGDGRCCGDAGGRGDGTSLGPADAGMGPGADNTLAGLVRVRPASMALICSLALGSPAVRPLSTESCSTTDPMDRVRRESDSEFCSGT